MSQKKEFKDNNQISIVIFQIGWEQFTIELFDVKEIIKAGQIRKLPRSLDYIEGIYNYRGEIIHIINLKKKLKLDEYILYRSNKSSVKENINNGNQFIIVLSIENTLVGFYTDRIINIEQIERNEIVDLSPIFQTSVAMEYIKGIINFEDRPRILLDISQILSEVEILKIQQEMSSLT